MNTPFPSATARPAVLELPLQTRIRVTGADRLRYLNGQLTQDLRRLTPALALPACVTNAKGRLQAEVRVTDTGDALVVDAAPELRESLAARLERYIVADDVALEDVTENETLFHVLTQSGEIPPALADFPRTQANRFGTPGTDVRVPSAQVEKVKEALGDQLKPASFAEALRIENGVPAWGAELDEATLPPEAGLEDTHIDYHKGCYIGQEVISRIRSVGHVNRKLVRLKGTGDNAPAQGEEIRVEGDSVGTPVGAVTSAICVQGTVYALGYIKRGVTGDRFEAGQIGLHRLP